MIRLPLTKEELARMISPASESDTHASAGLRRRGVLAVNKGRMIILDPAGLASVTGKWKGRRNEAVQKRKRPNS